MSAANIVSAAKQMERTRIIGLLQDYADAALGNGEMSIADRIVEIIGNVRVAEEADEMIVTEFPQGGELPEVQLNSDEEDAARLLRGRPARAGFAVD